MNACDFAKEYFEKCRLKDCEEMIQMLKTFNLKYSFGRIVDEFLDRNEEERKILKELENELKKEDFQKSFLEIKKILLHEEEKKLIEKIVKSSPIDVISIIHLKLNIEYKEYSLEQWQKHYENEVNAFEFLLKAGATSTLFILDDLYDYYKFVSGRFKNGEFSRFENLYNNDDRRILEKENYRKYGLIQCTEEFVLKEGNPPKIEDTKIGTHLIVEYIPNTFVKYLIELKKEYVFDLALRPNYDICDYGMKNLSILLESYLRWNEYETGLKKIPPVTKFYDDNSINDFVVVQNDSEGVTFEEILEDFDIVGDNIVVTQGVHFIYKDDEIVHLDHEFFFYSLEDFVDKEIDLRKKGTARKRFKTFKIDNAKIPFEADAEKNVVYKTLHTFFKKHNLIDEFFEKMK